MLTIIPCQTSLAKAGGVRSSSPELSFHRLADLAFSAKSAHWLPQAGPWISSEQSLGRISLSKDHSPDTADCLKRHIRYRDLIKRFLLAVRTPVFEITPPIHSQIPFQSRDRPFHCAVNGRVHSSARPRRKIVKQPCAPRLASGPRLLGLPCERAVLRAPPCRQSSENSRRPALECVTPLEHQPLSLYRLQWGGRFLRRVYGDRQQTPCKRR